MDWFGCLLLLCFSVLWFEFSELTYFGMFWCYGLLLWLFCCLLLVLDDDYCNSVVASGLFLMLFDLTVCLCVWLCLIYVWFDVSLLYGFVCYIGYWWFVVLFVLFLLLLRGWFVILVVMVLCCTVYFVLDLLYSVWHRLLYGILLFIVACLLIVWCFLLCLRVLSCYGLVLIVVWMILVGLRCWVCLIISVGLLCVGVICTVLMLLFFVCWYLVVVIGCLVAFGLVYLIGLFGWLCMFGCLHLLLECLVVYCLCFVWFDLF